MPRKKKNFECPNSFECLQSDMETETEASSPASSRSPSPSESRKSWQDDLERTNTPQERQQALLYWVQENDKLKRQLAEMEESNTKLKSLVSQLQAEADSREKANKRKKPTTSSSSDSEDANPAPKKPAPPTTRPTCPKPSTSRAPSRQSDAAPAAPVQPAAQDQPKASPAVRPVLMHAKDQWIAVSKRLAAKGIKYSKAKTIAQGIAITPATPEDHRLLTKTFNEEKQEYHTYSLSEERRLRITSRRYRHGRGK